MPDKASLGSFIWKLAEGFAGTKMTLDRQTRDQEDKARQLRIDANLAGIKSLDPDTTENYDEMHNYYWDEINNALDGKASGASKSKKDDGGFSLSGILAHFKPHFAKQTPQAPAQPSYPTNDVTADQSMTPRAAPKGDVPSSLSPQAPVVPQAKFLTPEERLQRSLRTKQLDSDIIQKREQENEILRYEHELKLRGMKTSRGVVFTYDGNPINGITEDTNGQPLRKDQDYMPLMNGNVPVAMMPQRGRVDASPLGRAFTSRKAEGRPEDDGKTDDAIRQDVARELATQARNKSQAAILFQGLRNATMAERLNQLRVLGPINAAAANLRVSALTLSNEQREKLATGDPKTVLAWATSVASDLATNPNGTFRGQNPVDIRDKFLVEHGYDPQDLLERSKQVLADVVIPSTTGSVAKPAASVAAPPVRATGSTFAKPAAAPAKAPAPPKLNEQRTIDNGKGGKVLAYWDGHGWLPVVKK